jgi:hypothetical protein
MDAILEWKFFGSLPTPARPCQPRGHWHWALRLPRLATLYPSPMAASPGIYGAKIDVKGWQLEREVAMTQRWPNWRLETSKYFLRWFSDLVRCYPILWDVLSRSVCNALQMDTALQSSWPKVSECCSRDFTCLVGSQTHLAWSLAADAHLRDGLSGRKKSKWNW